MRSKNESAAVLLRELAAAGSEVIAFRAFGGREGPRVQNGYFDDPAALMGAVGRLDGRYQTIAVALNPVDPQVLARGANRCAPDIKATQGSEVVARRFLAIDIDSVRPSGISATEEELAAAKGVADSVVEALTALGWPEPLFALSGNGFHVLYRIDLPVDDGELVKRVLGGLDLRFSSEQAKVDTSLHDPGRVIRLPGTMSCKGDPIEGRPHRRSGILSAPESLEVVDTRLLQQVADWVPAKPKRAASGHGHRFSLDEVVRATDSRVVAEKDWNGARVHLLDVCPFNSEHNDRSARLIEFGDGALVFKCHHDSCQANDLVALLHRCGLAEQPKRSTRVSKRVYRSLPRTDTGNAERLRERAGETLKYLPDRGTFAQWDGRRWLLCEDDIAIGATKAVVRSIAEEARHALTKEEGEELAKWALKSESKFRREAMLKLYKSEPGVLAQTSDFDRRPELLTFRNGTLDLDSRSLRPHDPADRITKLVPYDWQPDAKAPAFEAFLEQVLPDPEVRAFMQRLAGYTLSGSVEEQVAVLLVGDGANGKSTLLRAFQDVLGPELAIQTSSTILLTRKHEEHPTELTDLVSVRMAVGSEIEAGQELNEARLKSLTGGDRIRARRMRRNYFEFEPTHKLFLGVNSLPTVRGTDEGTWRRMVVVPFEQFIPEGERDSGLPGKFYAERAGIAAWAAEGYRQWREQGLALPLALCAAVEAYRLRTDVIARFLAERCVLDSQATCRAKELQEAFERFCTSSRGRAPAWKDVVASLSRRGITSKRSRRGNVYVGLQLAPQDLADRPPDRRGVQGVQPSPVSLTSSSDLGGPEDHALPTPTPSDGVEKRGCPPSGDADLEVLP